VGLSFARFGVNARVMTSFLEFALMLVIPGALVILLVALLLTRSTWRLSTSAFGHRSNSPRIKRGDTMTIKMDKQKPNIFPLVEGIDARDAGRTAEVIFAAKVQPK
jgi:hypothetical protein